MDDYKKKIKLFAAYGNTEREIKSLEDRYCELISEIENVKAMVYSDMPSGHKKTDLSDLEVRKESLGSKINSRVDRKQRIKEKIDKATEDLSREEVRVLELRYAELQHPRYIRDELGIKRSAYYRMHNKALEGVKLL